MCPSASTRSARPIARRLLAPLLLCALLALPAFLQAQSAGGTDSLSVPIDLFVDGRAEGTIGALISGDAVSVDRARLAEILGPRLDDSLLAELRSGAPEGTPEGTPEGGDLIPLAQLAGLGIRAEFDPSLIRVVIDVPAEKKRLRTIEVTGGRAPQGRAVVAPADFSAFVNLRARAEMSVGPALSFPLHLGVQPALNWRGWVLEADATADFDASWEAALETARLVKDFPSSSLRIAAGSLFLPVTGFMSAPSLAGIEIIRNSAAFRPEQPGESVGEELLLAERSLVDIFLNGRALGSLDLDPGRFLIPDIPFVTGINDLVIGGERRVVAYDTRLLPAGETAFSASLGVPQWTLASPVASGFFLRGFSPFVTAGVDLQAGLDRQLGGAEILLATRAGSLRGLAGMSLAPGTGADFSGLLEYRLAFPAAPRLPAIGLSARYTGRSFLGPGDERSENPFSWQLAGSVSQALPFGFGMNLGLGWQAGWAPNPDSAAAALTLTRSLGTGTSLALLLTTQFSPGSPADIRGLFTLTSSSAGGRRSAGMTAVLNGGSSSVDVQVQPGAQGAPSFFASLNGLPTDAGGMSGSVGARYSGPLLETTLSDSFSAGLNTLSLEAGMALVTAGGAVGVSRPVADSFALVIPQQNMKGQKIVVNSGGGGREAVAERGRPGVLPWLASYAPTSITIEAPDAPPGSEPGDYLRTLAPAYRSGVAVKVGTHATIYAEGYLLTGEGKAAAFLAGEARLEGDPQAEPVSFFTDENGQFQVYGLAPGSWEIRFGGDEPFAASFSIPTDAQGLYEVGSIRLPILQRKGQ